MKIKYFLFGMIFAILLSSLAYLNKSNIRPLAQPLFNFIQKGSLKIENINSKEFEYSDTYWRSYNF